MYSYDIAIASDHAGVILKSKIISFLEKKNLNVLNLGTNSNKSVDYSDFSSKVIERIIKNTIPVGILICGTGIGMSIAANRNRSIRAALCTTEYMAQHSKMHNNANILVLGSKIISSSKSLKIVQKFLETSFEGGRHSNRVGKIS